MIWNAVSICFIVIFSVPLLVSLWLERLNRNYVEKKGSKLPQEFRDFIDDALLERSNRYLVEGSTFASFRRLVMDAVLMLVVCSGFLMIPMYLSKHWGIGYVSEGLIFFALLSLLLAIIELPWEYYAVFVLEERFGFNRTDVRTWIQDLFKEAGIHLVLLIIVLGPVLQLIKTFPNSWWLWAFLAVSFFQLLMTVLYPVIIAPLFNTFEPLQDKILAEKTEQLVRGVGLTPRGIFQMDAGRRSAHSNAYFTGLGKTKRVVLFDTLLQSHSHDEILGILAHELGHFKLKHIAKSFLLIEAMLFAGFFSAYLLFNWDLLYKTFNVDPSQSYVALFLIEIFLQRAAFFLKPSFTALSRHFEREADYFAVQLQGDSKPLATALKRLAADNLSNLNPHPWHAWFFRTHPPLVERLSALENRHIAS